MPEKMPELLLFLKTGVPELNYQYCFCAYLAYCFSGTREARLKKNVVSLELLKPGERGYIFEESLQHAASTLTEPFICCSHHTALVGK